MTMLFLIHWFDFSLVTSIYEVQDTEVHAKPTEVDDVISIRVRITGKGKQIVYGKWIVCQNVDRVDDIWQKIVQAMKNDELGGCTEVKSSTRFYNPSAYGPGPITTSQISVYTSEENKMEVGEKLIHLVQQDIRYKLERDTQRRKYRYTNPELEIECYYYNRGNPSITFKGIKCYGYDMVDVWHLNIVVSPDLHSDEIFGYWKLEVEDKPLTDLWHYLKDKIHSKENSLGVIKMVCPEKKKRRDEKPMFQAFTSKANMMATGLTLIHILEKNIEYKELESGHITKVTW